MPRRKIQTTTDSKKIWEGWKSFPQNNTRCYLLHLADWKYMVFYFPHFLVSRFKGKRQEIIFVSMQFSSKMTDKLDPRIEYSFNFPFNGLI